MLTHPQDHAEPGMRAHQQSFRTIEIAIDSGLNFLIDGGDTEACTVEEAGSAQASSRA